MNSIFKWIICLLFSSIFRSVSAQDKALIDKAATQIEIVHSQIWNRFMDKNHILIDFTDLDEKILLPTPEELKLGKPNALGWWSPIENGAMFGGLYMDGAIARWKATHKEEDAEKARNVAKGLMLLASISKVEGFVARGVAADGVSHFPMGSNDQSGPWFYALWRYLQTDLASNEQRMQIENKLEITAQEIVYNNWKMPAEPPFYTRGSFAGFNFGDATRQLFVAKLMEQITKKKYWKKLYQSSLKEFGGKANLSRQEICEQGMFYDGERRITWTESIGMCCLRGLWEMESDSVIKESFRKGLEISAKRARKSLFLGLNFNQEESGSLDIDWRKMNVFWKKQFTEQEAEEIAHVQHVDLMNRSPRWGLESLYVREPIFAAWIVTLSPDKNYVKSVYPEIINLINHFEYSKIYHVWFFPIEAAWWRSRDSIED